MAKHFTGRKHELSELNRLYRKNEFQMVVLYGRRRVGKTTLAFEFAKDKPTLAFTAKVQSDAMNLADFSRTINEHFGLPLGTAFSSWDQAFSFVARQAREQHLVFIFDEFPYAASASSGLLSSLQAIIDHQLSHTNIFFIITGSNQGFMKEKVLGDASTGFVRALGERNPLFGRRTAQIHLAPFSYLEAAQMLANTEPEQLVAYYACFGGTPYYLSMIDEDQTLLENLGRLFFTKEGLLYEEPLMLLRQELREPAVYSSILDAIANGANRQHQIADRVGEERTKVGKYMLTLRSMGLIRRTAPFGENAQTSRKGIYQLAEPCFAFWYRFVQRHIDAIEQHAGSLVLLETLQPDILVTYTGHWFEEICRAWLIDQAKLGETPFTPTAFGSWWGTNPATRQQEEIDVVIGNPARKQLLVGECKWRNQVNEREALELLAERARLVPGYEQTWRALFTKEPVSTSTRARYADDRVLFVCAEDIYRDR